jgi:hypothetical protein
MKAATQPDWAAIRLDYIKNQEMTQESLAEKWGVTPDQVRGRAYREKWAQAREDYSAQYAERLTQLSIRNDAPVMLKALNEKVLKQSEELRVMLNMKLKMRDAQGKIVVRPDVSIIELRCACAAFAELFRMDRLALGASTDNVAVASTQSSYDNMTEEQLVEELRQVRQRVGIQ